MYISATYYTTRVHLFQSKVEPHVHLFQSKVEPKTAATPTTNVLITTEVVPPFISFFLFLPSFCAGPGALVSGGLDEAPTHHRWLWKKNA